MLRIILISAIVACHFAKVELQLCIPIDGLPGANGVPPNGAGKHKQFNLSVAITFINFI
jgi:hypothetical protein